MGLEILIENSPRQTRQDRIGRRDIFGFQMLAELGRTPGDDFGSWEFFRYRQSQLMVDFKSGETGSVPEGGENFAGEGSGAWTEFQHMLGILK